MNINNPYNVRQGLMIISPGGSQKYTEKLDSYSQVLTSLYASTYNNNNKYNRLILIQKEYTKL